MKIDAKKLERQLEGVEKWFSSSQFGASKDMEGCLNWITGMGKTFASVLIIKRLLKVSPIHNIIIVVPIESLIGQWNKVLVENFTNKDITRLEVFSASYILLNKIKIKTNTLIVDELHLFLGEEFIKVINGHHIQCENRLGLTATYEDPSGRHKMYQNIFPIIDEIGEKEAIQKGFISAYRQFNLSVKLTDEEQEKYNNYSDIIAKTLSKFGGNLNLATKCLSGGKHANGTYYEAANWVFGYAASKGWKQTMDLNIEHYAKINELWHPNLIFGYAKHLMRAVKLRKDLMYNCISKVYTTIEIIEKYKGYKSIVFGQKVDYADKVNSILNERYPNYSVVYHSQLPVVFLPSEKTGKLIKFGAVRQKKAALLAIKTGKARNIATASSLDTGFDEDSLEIGIIGSGTANFNKQKQREGRVKRKSSIFAEDKVKLIVNLYVKNTVDERWLKTRQSKSGEEVYWVDSVEEINFNPSSKREFKIETM